MALADANREKLTKKGHFNDKTEQSDVLKALMCSRLVQVRAI